jgi:hypothetical protein
LVFFRLLLGFLLLQGFGSVFQGKPGAAHAGLRIVRIPHVILGQGGVAGQTHHQESQKYRHLSSYE